MADAAASNSNRRRNNRTYQDTTCPPTLFISEIIPKSNQLRLLGMSYQQIAKSLRELGFAKLRSNLRIAFSNAANPKLGEVHFFIIKIIKNLDVF